MTLIVDLNIYLFKLSQANAYFFGHNEKRADYKFLSANLLDDTAILPCFFELYHSFKTS